MKLLVAIPCTEFMHAEFVKCLVQLQKKLTEDEIPYDVTIVHGTLVYLARDKLANAAIVGGYTHVLWLDCDMIFNEDLLSDFLFCGKDFVTGVYCQRRKPYFSVIFDSLRPISRVEKFETQPFQIEGCGFGVVLIKTDILRKIMDIYGNCFTPTSEFGEDLAFCEKCIESGIEIWCDPSVRAGHLAHVPLWPDQPPAFGTV